MSGNNMTTLETQLTGLYGVGNVSKVARCLHEYPVELPRSPFSPEKDWEPCVITRQKWVMTSLREPSPTDWKAVTHDTPRQLFDNIANAVEVNVYDCREAPWRRFSQRLLLELFFGMKWNPGATVYANVKTMCSIGVSNDGIPDTQTVSHLGYSQLSYHHVDKQSCYCVPDDWLTDGEILMTRNHRHVTHYEKFLYTRMQNNLEEYCVIEKPPNVYHRPRPDVPQLIKLLMPI